MKTTVSRKPNRICTPVWATRTSWMSSLHIRSARSSSVSVRPRSRRPASLSLSTVSASRPTRPHVLVGLRVPRGDETDHVPAGRFV
ncbi:hypothetical protein ADL01_17345 [Streptomyces sp. NRRL WC-3618]|nr:hypothetical protein ADL01_17345 [Streptomyces sp. NRRL WC-3618]